MARVLAFQASGCGFESHRSLFVQQDGSYPVSGRMERHLMYRFGGARLTANLNKVKPII